MRFRDTEQRAKTCHVLMKLVRMERFFIAPTEIGHLCGPTAEAENEWIRMQANESSLSNGEKTMLLFTFYVWNDRGNPMVRDLERLESTLTRAVGTLIGAASSKNAALVDEWLKVWEQVDTAAEYFAS